MRDKSRPLWLTTDTQVYRNNERGLSSMFMAMGSMSKDMATLPSTMRRKALTLWGLTKEGLDLVMGRRVFFSQKRIK